MLDVGRWAAGVFPIVLWIVDNIRRLLAANTKTQNLSRRSSKSSARRARASQNKPRSRFPWKFFFLKCALVCAVIVGTVLAVYHWRAGQLDIRQVERMKERSTVFDMDGKVWGRMQGENRVPVALADVSPAFIAALLAREDTRFFSHPGVDWKGILRAVVRTAQGQSQGGSTLTQQLARNSFDELGQRKSLDRKLLEVFVALRIEKAYSKEEVLSHYVNRIYFGSGVYGIEMASKVYFAKSARELSLSEAAMIAGIIRAPTRASPFSNPKRAQAEREMVLDRLMASDCERIRERYGIGPDAVAAARKQPLKVAAARRVTTQENYAMDMVMRELDVLLDDEQQIQGGLKIYTTIDPVLQEEAQKALDRALTKVEQRPGYNHPRKADYSDEARKEELPTEYLQGSVVAVDNRTGGIRALVGGRDYRDSKFNRAIDAKRTVGSTFKPFVYAAAIAKGLSPDTEISDGPIQPGEIAKGAGWHPGNSDDKFGGMLPMDEGLIHSRNTMTVRVGDHAGLDAVVEFAAKVGLPDVPLNPQSYIGNFGASPKDVTLAYTVLANGGLRRQGYMIERIDSPAGEVVFRAAHIKVTGADRGVCATTTGILCEVMQRGTGAGSKALGWTKPSAGKTGTTDGYHDAWFVGYTTSLTCGVWVGLDKPATIIPRGYGAALALPVWVDVMKRASPEKYPAASLTGGGAPRPRVISPAVARTGGDDGGGGLRKPESRSDGGVLRSFRKFFGGQ
jgi:penicillin-binding protein 1A